MWSETHSTRWKLTCFELKVKCAEKVEKVIHNFILHFSRTPRYVERKNFTNIWFPIEDENKFEFPKVSLSSQRQRRRRQHETHGKWENLIVRFAKLNQQRRKWKLFSVLYYFHMLHIISEPGRRIAFAGRAEIAEMWIKENGNFPAPHEIAIWLIARCWNWVFFHVVPLSPVPKLKFSFAHSERF